MASPPTIGSAENTGASLVLLTAMFSVASTAGAMLSLTLTVKTFSPTSALAGTPEREPSAATTSQAGPETLANSRVLPFASLASFANALL